MNILYSILYVVFFHCEKRNLFGSSLNIIKHYFQHESNLCAFNCYLSTGQSLCWQNDIQIQYAYRMNGEGDRRGLGKHKVWNITGYRKQMAELSIFKQGRISPGNIFSLWFAILLSTFGTFEF